MPVSKREGGWQTLKRTGVEEFFRRLGPYYEIVVFTQQTPFVRLRAHALLHSGAPDAHADAITVNG